MASPRKAEHNSTSKFTVWTSTHNAFDQASVDEQLNVISSLLDGELLACRISLFISL